MKCAHCDKKYTHKKGASRNICPTCLETGLRFYKLGLQDGEQRVRKTINVLKETNRNQWEEMSELDRIFPLDGTFVRVPIPLMKKVVRAKKTNWEYWCKKLKKLMKDQLGNLPDFVDEASDGKGKETKE